MKRQIFLHVETTGTDPAKGHRIVEIGSLELVDGRRTGKVLHHYLNPQREMDDWSIEINGLCNAYLADKPVFTDVARELLDFFRGAELVCFLAPSDVGFLNHELEVCDKNLGRIEDICEVTDIFTLAKKMYPDFPPAPDALDPDDNIDGAQPASTLALRECEQRLAMYRAMLVHRETA